MEKAARCRAAYSQRELFWEDIELQIAEGLRQRAERPKLEALISATEAAVFERSRRCYYAALAAKLFGELLAATRLQAAARGMAVRRWYREYRKTAEFAARQTVYETAMRARSRLRTTLPSGTWAPSPARARDS